MKYINSTILVVVFLFCLIISIGLFGGFLKREYNAKLESYQKLVAERDKVDLSHGIWRIFVPGDPDSVYYGKFPNERKKINALWIVVDIHNDSGGVCNKECTTFYDMQIFHGGDCDGLAFMFGPEEKGPYTHCDKKYPVDGDSVGHYFTRSIPYYYTYDSVLSLTDTLRSMRKDTVLTSSNSAGSAIKKKILMNPQFADKISADRVVLDKSVDIANCPSVVIWCIPVPKKEVYKTYISHSEYDKQSGVPWTKDTSVKFPKNPKHDIETVGDCIVD